MLVQISTDKFNMYFIFKRRELRAGDVDVVRQALNLLSNLLHKPENITTACREGNKL